MDSPLGSHLGSSSTRKEVSWREEQFLHLCEIEKELEVAYDSDETTMFSDSELERFQFSRGVPLEVDERYHAQSESTYFLPCPLEEVVKAIATQTRPWKVASPRKVLARDATMPPPVDQYNLDCMRNAVAHDDFMISTARQSYRRWSGFCQINNIYCSRWWFKSEGTGVMDTYSDGRAFKYPGSEPWGTPEACIHAIGTVRDIDIPEDDCVMRSELMKIINLLKGTVGHATVWPNHRIFPVLIVSFHSGTSARIIQAHLKDGKIIMRLSRLLRMDTEAVPDDAKPIVQWLLSEPVGNTHFPSLTFKNRIKLMKPLGDIHGMRQQSSGEGEKGKEPVGGRVVSLGRVFATLRDSTRARTTNDRD